MLERLYVPGWRMKRAVNTSQNEVQLMYSPLIIHFYDEAVRFFFYKHICIHL